MWSVLLTAAVVVSAGPLAAQDSAAKVIYQVGQVSLASDGLFKALSVGDAVKARQLIITGPDGYAQFQVLSDGSTFEVFPNSKVYFRSTPGNWQHLLEVMIGRIKVFIQHAPGVPNPNQVTSPTAVISVRGTVFDVLVQDDEGTTSVTVDEGEVAVRNTTAPGNPVILHPGDSITVYYGQRLIAAGIDKGNVLRQMLYRIRDGILSHPPIGGNGGSGPIATSPGAQGDKGKPSGNGDKGSTPGAPPNASGAPPSAPGAPPNAPGGGN
jgi:hypothetical protein